MASDRAAPAAPHAPVATAALWAPLAWLPGGWHDDVLLTIDADGRWADVTVGVATPPAYAEVLASPLLPALADAHSHAFQRAFAGGAERRDAASDDFWSWRERMYAVASRIGPEALQAIAAQLYVELLKGGYSHVCEFHYLRRDPGGTDYADPLAMSWALAAAAEDVGIGLTILPVLYERFSFDTPLRENQRRFRASAEETAHAAHAIVAAGRPRVDAGLAIHSLRAASADGIVALAALAHGLDGPIHVHVAEQTAEADACLAATGKRPIEWLTALGIDRRWQLVHATHAAPGEIDAVAASGAGVVVCPGTEANLGDGLFDLPRWLASGVPLSVGSDSHATRDWREELRLLEYGQRLARRERNVAAAPERGEPSSAERLFARMVEGSRAATHRTAWGLVAGARADALVVDASDDALLGVAPRGALDALVFSSPTAAWRDVMVGGRWVVRDGRHPRAAPIAARFAETLRALAR